MKKYDWLIGCLMVCSWIGCRHELPLLSSEGETVTAPASGGRYKGVFLLNEGNMGSNKASLDYFDYATGSYQRNLYAERNPEVVKELGDVGNDLEVYGDKLFAVINCSHYVEVMSVYTGKHIASIDVQNCRHITFYGQKAYVSSYAGPVQLDPNARPGKIVEIDLNTYSVTREVVVGYQPEEMVISEGKLYVANSGGYRAPNYDRTVSVVDLNSFRVVNAIDVALNPGGMALDGQGRIYVSAQGDRKQVRPDIYVIDTKMQRVTGRLGSAAHEMCLCGDSLYVLDAAYTEEGERSVPHFRIYDVKKQQWVSQKFITDGTELQLKTPYGLAVNPDTREIFLTDATNYVTPGYLYCYSKEGKLRWKVMTGDIPAHLAFTTRPFYPNEGTLPLPQQPETGQPSPYVTKVLEYCPAPGQFVNEMPLYEPGDTDETMKRKVLEYIGRGRKWVVSLGGYGGYLTVGFDHTIQNKPDACDFRVLGNAIHGEAGSGSEPGIIQVAYDRNGNKQPDADEWYEIAGSGHLAPEQEDWFDKAQQAGNDVKLYRHYQITYHRPAKEPVLQEEVMRYIRWTDNQGREGFRRKNTYHKQPYYPQWVSKDQLVFQGTCLPQNSIDEGKAGAHLFVLYPYRYGYADNYPNGHTGAEIDLDWAVDADGQPVHLPGVDFIRIYTGVNQENGWIGECSTEIAGVEDLNL